MTAEEFLSLEQPTAAMVRRMTVILRGFTSTTQALLALAEFYASFEDASPEWQTHNTISAETIRRFALEFADHEGKNL